MEEGRIYGLTMICVWTQHPVLWRPFVELKGYAGDCRYKYSTKKPPICPFDLGTPTHTL